MSSFVHDGITFSFREVGAGAPFVFQHGLGGDVNQIADTFTPPSGIRLLTLDCRGHGATEPLGDESSLNFSAFADDVVALLDHLGIEQAIVGGISMGAGVALSLALRYTARVRAMVLARPAWLDRPLPAHLLVYPAIAYLLHTYGPEQGSRRFTTSGAFAQILAVSPDAAASLLGQFAATQASARVARLECIPLDCPWTDLAACARLALPVLVLANRQDPIHPYDLALRLAQSFIAPQVVAVTTKSVSKERYRADMQAAIAAFLPEAS
jgi:pimeloyl-ACP methyl ester carboxylesterase